MNPSQLVREAEGHLTLKMAAVQISRGNAAAVTEKVQAVADLREACGIWLAAIEQWVAGVEKARKAERS